VWKTGAMLILASRSKARQILLSNAGLDFETAAATIDERAVEAGLGVDAKPELVARRLAEAKALDVAARYPQAWVIGADQTLALDGELFHKPETLAAARDQLDRLCGRTHRLHSAVVLARAGQVSWAHVETAELTMRAFASAERDGILRREGGEALTSVGGYRLEGPAVRLFETIRGDYFTILGLPLLPLLGALRQYAPEIIEGFT
jgi:septum formation protein